MEDLTPEQKPFARKREEFAPGARLDTLEKAAADIHPTILVGTSTCAGAFTESIVREIASHCIRPMIFPEQSHGTGRSQSLRLEVCWTEGRVPVATGIPSEPVEYNGVSYAIGQANNALIYPGLGLGVIASQARLLTDGMISPPPIPWGGHRGSGPARCCLGPAAGFPAHGFSETVPPRQEKSGHGRPAKRGIFRSPDAGPVRQMDTGPLSTGKVSNFSFSEQFK